MITIMNYSINTTVTGNKIIIVCSSNEGKMFPFATTELPCQLPVGNQTHLVRLVKDCQKHCQNIFVLAPANSHLPSELHHSNCTIIEKRKDFLNQIYELGKDNQEVTIVEAELVISSDILDNYFQSLQPGKTQVGIKPLAKYEHSTNHICVTTENERITSFLGHPRPHYSNHMIMGIATLSNEAIHFLAHSATGFHNINCGQMPDDNYYLTEALQNYLESNGLISSYSLPIDTISLTFPWDILAANKQYCQNFVASINTSSIDDSAIIADDCNISGNVQIGKNSKISNQVVIEGNCLIGDNVEISNHAIIGKNCVIGSNSHINNFCKVNDNTVIGSENKIGFCAEISGVTFSGVSAVHNCEVAGVIGKRVDIAAGVQMAILRFDDTYTIQKVQAKRYWNPFTNSVFIGDYTRTGIGNLFYPGVKVGSKSALGPGLIVTHDIGNNNLVLVQQTILTKDWGSDHYGW